MNALAALLEARGDLKGASKQYRSAYAANGDLWPAAYNLSKLEQKLAVRTNPKAVSAEAISLLEECTFKSSDIQPKLLLTNLYLRRALRVSGRRRSR